MATKLETAAGEDELLAQVASMSGSVQKRQRRKERRKTLTGVLFAVLLAAAAAVVVSILIFPVIRITGSSMTPTLNSGDVVISMKYVPIQAGDVLGVDYGNQVIIKRCIATEGQWVDIDQEGNVTVDGVVLDEPYVSEKSLGACNIILPYQVPANSYFVMGDHRETSVDSRNTAIGCIAKEYVTGKIVFCIWPLSDFGLTGAAN